jgi:hypothetical protein
MSNCQARKISARIRSRGEAVDQQLRQVERVEPLDRRQ